jgi:hypothetical protein
MKRPITDASGMTVIWKLSPFLIVRRIGNVNRQFEWLQGSLKRKNLVAEAYFERRTSLPAHFVSPQTGMTIFANPWLATNYSLDIHAQETDSRFFAS